MSRARLTHVARVISIFSTRGYCGQQTDYISCSLHPLRTVLSDLEDSNNIKADYVSSDILHASRQFATSEFCRHLYSLRDRRIEQRNESVTIDEDMYFFVCYLCYLYSMKDVCESTRLVYWEQMRRYCDSILAVLNDNWSSGWIAHFVFTYCHLLHDSRYYLTRKLSHVDFKNNLSNMDVGIFGDIIRYVAGLAHRDSPFPYFDDLAKISHDLIEDTKKEAIFAKSACFCIVLLCDERCASQDAAHIYGISKYDRRRKREHPWHWRQMVPRPPSLGNRLALHCGTALPTATKGFE
ncbi:hypothetical protein CPC08DRAFT_269477 [Agrocybe pediades]|nr:hypothetical protein CPC08DRAFT_269477 [Agrocybe pediades]